MKHAKAIIIFLLFAFCIKAQIAIQWEKSFGGSSWDLGYSIVQTSDGGYAITGTVRSTNGDVSANNGIYDFWVAKLNSTGALQWEKSYGGTGQERAYSIKQTFDGGYIVAGLSNTNNGDVSGNHGSYDYWVIKINSTGVLQWQKSLGGSSGDEGFSVIQDSDSNYVVAGHTSSNNGDVSGNHGSYDYWVVKLNLSGNIIWQKTFGGSDADWGAYGKIQIAESVNGGYIVAGDSRSIDGDVTGNNGWMDYWIARINKSGNLIWQQSYGGSGFDHANAVFATADGGYAVAGASQSTNGDVTGHHGINNYDYWVVKTDTSGNIQWEKSLGGLAHDHALSIIQTTDGGYLVTGYSQSNDADVSGNNGDIDYWLVKLNSTGILQWQKSLGGMQDDIAYGVIETSDGNIAIAGHSASNNSGDVTNSNGLDDLWIVKLCYITLPSIVPSGSSVFCQGGSVMLNAGAGYASYAWSNGASTQTINATLNGIYTVTVNNASGCSAKTTHSVTVHALPVTPNITANGPISFCQGDSVTLYTAGTYHSYLWNNSSTNTSITVTQSGIYSVTVTNINGCSSLSSTLTVTVNPAPSTPTITQIGNVLQSSVASGNQWYLNGTIINGANSQILLPSASGNYTVIVTDINGCTSVSSMYIYVAPAVDEILNTNKFYFTPNPFHESTQLIFDSHDKVQLLLYDELGRDVSPLVFQEKNYAGTIFLHNNGLADGVYLYKIVNADSSAIIASGKLIVSK